MAKSFFRALTRSITRFIIRRAGLVLAMGGILGAAGKPFERVRYFFKHGPRTVRKEVVWFLMKPVVKSGKMDPKEVRKVRWFSFGMFTPAILAIKV
jgi:hypothetical protein